MPIKIHSNGYPLLHIAAYKGETNIVKWLLDRGVDINLNLYYGVAPDLNLDTEAGYDEVVQTLTDLKPAPDGDEKTLSERKFFS